MPRNYWFVSDTHFGHENILKWSATRSGLFNSAKEMDEHMIEQWNSVVKQGDIVYHLGDVFLGPNNQERKAKVMSRLKGSKRLILGNHDDVKDLSRGGWFKKVMLWRVWDTRPLLFSHVPVHESSLSERVISAGGINVHGHTHDNGSPEGPYLSVCVEKTNFRPINLDEIES